ncbi:hypothetical protein [Kineococcus sp. SYSU DK003]|uniref:hypothetical protein n=1 Tax=Kineococcus sp. SYSU DK003 TaxID=3383124 RepID=UPI003D7E7584
MNPGRPSQNTGSGARWVETGLVVTSKVGTPLGPGHVRRDFRVAIAADQLGPGAAGRLQEGLVDRQEAEVGVEHHERGGDRVEDRGQVQSRGRLLLLSSQLEDSCAQRQRPGPALAVPGL